MTTITTRNQRNAPPAPQATPQAQAVVESRPDRIRRRAYEIFQARNGGPGDHLSDWAQAEREVNTLPPALPAQSAGPAGPRTDARRGRTARSEADV